MRKVLFQIGSFSVYSYGFMIAIGIILAGVMFMKRADKEKYNDDSLFNALFLTVLFGMLGGKILYILVNIKSVIDDPSILLNYGEGFVVYGGILAGVIALAFYSKKKKWNVLETFDLAAPSVALGQAFGRIGCFLAGCCYGKETNLWIGVKFPTNSLAPSGVYLHPTQLYSSAFDFALVIVLILFARNNKKKGRVFSMYLILYSIGRFLVEFLRNDERGAIGILSTSQFIAIFTLILGIIIFNCDKLKRRVKKSEE